MNTPAPSPASTPPLPLLFLLLSMTTGLVDAISVLGLGKVFTANMTGNIVFLGFAAVGTPDFHAEYHVVALTAFLLGALGGGRLGQSAAGRPLRQHMLFEAALEAVLLWAAAVIALCFDIAAQEPRWALLSIIGLTSLAMGLRNATIRKLKVPDITTTVLTLTLTGLAADSRMAGGANPNWGRRVGAVAAIFVGAALGAFLVMHSGLVAPLVLAGLLVLVGTAACAIHPGSAQPAG